MAEIKIQEKRGSYWPWLVGILAVLIGVWIWAAVADPEDDQQQAAADVAPSAGVPAGTSGTMAAPIREYVQFARDANAMAGNADMGRAHGYTAEGLRKLDAALEHLVQQRPSEGTRTSLDGFRQAAQRIQRDPSSEQHAGTVREAFTRAAELIAGMNAGAGTSVQEAAESIKADAPLLAQRENVQRFFRESAEALERLSGVSG